jgi:FkbM family methyltransferase
MLKRGLAKIANNVISSMAGKKKFQSFFERLHQISVNGMNVGTGSFIDESGEKKAIEYVHEKLMGTINPILFDVGANVGLYAALLKQIFIENSEVYCFEPSKKTFERLLINTEATLGINAFNFGFGDKAAAVTLFSDAEESGMASVYPRRLDHFGIKMNNSEEIEIKTIDDFCLENHIERINFLKIDVEGNEMKVLHGADRLIKANAIDFIQFEFGGTNIDSKTYFQDFYYLLKDKYYIYRIVKDGLYRITNYRELYEIFSTTNYLAELIK